MLDIYHKIELIKHLQYSLLNLRCALQVLESDNEPTQLCNDLLSDSTAIKHQVEIFRNNVTNNLNLL